MLDVTGHEQPPQGAPHRQTSGCPQGTDRPAGAGVRGVDRLRGPRKRGRQPDRRRHSTATCWSGSSSSRTSWPCWSSTSPPSSGIVTGKSLPEILGERLRPFWRARLLGAGRNRGRRHRPRRGGGRGDRAVPAVRPAAAPRRRDRRRACRCSCSRCRPGSGSGPSSSSSCSCSASSPSASWPACSSARPIRRASSPAWCPRFQGPDTVLLAASMLGATVMPHAIYVHSALSRDRHRPDRTACPAVRHARLVRATRWDVVAALAIAGIVNIGMLLLAASTLGGEDGHRHHRGRARRHHRQPGPGRRRGLRRRAAGLRPGLHLGGLLRRRHHHAGPAQDPDPAAWPAAWSR